MEKTQQQHQGKVQKGNVNVAGSNVGAVSGTTVLSKSSGSSLGKLVVVLVRGLIDLSQEIKDTLRMLRLTRKNQCVVVDDTPSVRGMVVKVKDCVTFGPISPETFAQLVGKRGVVYLGRKGDSHKKYGYGMIAFNGKEYLPYFRLNPPRKGFGRKGIKVAFTVGGALGNRGEKINDLVTRML